MMVITRTFWLVAVLALGGSHALAGGLPEWLDDENEVEKEEKEPEVQIDFGPRRIPVPARRGPSREAPVEVVEARDEPAEAAPEPEALEWRPGSDVGAHCPGSDTLKYRKRVALTSFTLAAPDHATLGELRDVQRELPRGLYRRLDDRGQMIPFSATESRLFRRVQDSPTRQRSDNRLTRAMEASREMDVQFIVSGVVRDMSVADQSAWGTSKVNQWRGAMGRTNRDRRFVVDLFVHDGFSGALVMERRFETSGEWGFKPNQRVGFGTREFDDSDYGRAVQSLMDEMAAAIADNVVCQPFMAQVQRVDDTRIRIATGAESGVRPGDELQLYRTERFLDQSDAMPELRNTGHSLVVRQVQPDYSSGSLPVQGHRINVQRGDMVVVW